MTFIALRLAENVEIQNKMYDECLEVKQHLGDASITYDILNGMKYTEMVINEGLRMCPIATELKRRATKPYVLENRNGATVAINPGDAVWLPAFIMQNDPQYYPNPKKFDPERFNDENRRLHVSGTYAPFGMGPRGLALISGICFRFFDFLDLFPNRILNINIELCTQIDSLF